MDIHLGAVYSIVIKFEHAAWRYAVDYYRFNKDAFLLLSQHDQMYFIIGVWKKTRSFVWKKLIVHMLSQEFHK